MPDYLISVSLPNDPLVRERIVRAKNRAQAIAHVVADTIKVDTATIDDAMRLAANGGKVEQAAE